MKLYNMNHSPYATRVRMLIRKKGLAVEILDPPVATGTPEFVEKFPLGKIPVLELDDGTQLPDSWVIMEYLDSLPGTQLVPAEPLARAHMQLLARYADTYLGPFALFPLFQRVVQPGGTEGADEVLEALDKELARLERLLNSLPDFADRDVHAGDMVLATNMEYVLMLAPMFGVAEPLAQYPGVARWNAWVSEDEAVLAGVAEMKQAVAAFFG